MKDQSTFLSYDLAFRSMYSLWALSLFLLREYAAHNPLKNRITTTPAITKYGIELYGESMMEKTVIYPSPRSNDSILTIPPWSSFHPASSKILSSFPRIFSLLSRETDRLITPHKASRVEGLVPIFFAKSAFLFSLNTTLANSRCVGFKIFMGSIVSELESESIIKTIPSFKKDVLSFISIKKMGLESAVNTLETRCTTNPVEKEELAMTKQDTSTTTNLEKFPLKPIPAGNLRVKFQKMRQKLLAVSKMIDADIESPEQFFLTECISGIEDLADHYDQLADQEWLENNPQYQIQMGVMA